MEQVSVNVPFAKIVDCRNMEPLDGVNASAYRDVTGKQLLLTSFGDLLLMDLLLTTVQGPARLCVKQTEHVVVRCSALGWCNGGTCFPVHIRDSAYTYTSAIPLITYLLFLLQLQSGTATLVHLQNASDDASCSQNWADPNVVKTSVISMMGHSLAYHHVPAYGVHHDVPTYVDAICSPCLLNIVQRFAENANIFEVCGSPSPYGIVALGMFCNMFMCPCTSTLAFSKSTNNALKTLDLRLRGGTSLYMDKQAVSMENTHENHTANAASPRASQRNERASALILSYLPHRMSLNAETSHSPSVSIDGATSAEHKRLLSRRDCSRKQRRQITQRLQLLHILLQIQEDTSIGDTLDIVLRTLHTMLSKVRSETEGEHF